jgi:hypothetical protein
MKNILLALVMVLSISIFGLTQVAAADTATKNQIRCGVNAVGGAANGDCTTNPNTGTDINDLITKIIDILSALVGAAAVIMLIVGGFRYVTSAGSEKSVESAKKTILYALVGLVIVALAQVIVHFVLNNLTTTK